MSISWQLNLYNSDTSSFIDFTDRMQGFDVRQIAKPAMLGTGEALFRLTNYDGALTPNGGGTYSNIEWAKCYFILYCTTPSDSHTVFVGFAANFTFVDQDGVSMVDFDCDDPYAIIGRGLVEDGFVSPSGSFFDYIPETIQDYINNGALVKVDNGIKLPTAGATSAEANVIDVSATPATLAYSRNQGEGRISERIQNGILPASAGVLWPGELQILSGVAYWRAYCVGEGLSHDNTYGGSRQEYTLTETPTGDDLVLNTVQTGHNLTELTNAVNIKVQGDGDVTTAEYISRDDGSAEQFGERGAVWRNHFEARNRGTTGGGPAAARAIDMQPLIDALTNRFSDYRFGAVKATTKLSQATTTAQQNKFGVLTDIRHGQWATVEVIYTPTATTVTHTDATVITRRRLRGTPSDTTIELDLLPAVDYQSLVLDSPILGVLAGTIDAATYDDSGETYDSATPYDGGGTVFVGNRLG